MKKYETATEVPIEIIQLWEAAWLAQPYPETPMEIEFPDRKALVTFRQHAYQARKRLLAENYPGSANFMKLTIKELSETKIGICLPAWFKGLQKTLKDAGVEPNPVIDAEPASREAPTLPESPDSLETEEILPQQSSNLKAVQALFKPTGESK